MAAILSTRSEATNTLACDDEKNRKFEKLPPSEWGDQFLSVHVDVFEMNELGREMDTMKPKVNDMFMSFKGVDSTKKNILFIYLLVTFGLAYHFEDEIEKSLKEGFEKIEEMMAGEDDLYTVSIIFWVFRTYGYNISADVFKRFKGDNGKFKECLTGDVKGILSLYEAAQMGMTTDYILDEASSFALSYLEPLAASGTCQIHLARHIKNSLTLSQHKNMEIIVTMEYIRFFEQEEDCDKMLLKFAKLNFKFLQLHYLQELKILSKWYKDQRFESKLPPYYRDRLVELNLVTLAYLEPKYSRVRIVHTKLFTVQILMDDTCDRYASLREVESLANTLERWDLDDAMDGQPEYLKCVAKFIIKTFKEIEREMGSELGATYSLEATIEECKRMMRANLQLAKWAATGYLPSFEEYINVAGVEIAVYVTIATTLLGMKDICKEDAYDWLKSRDKLVRAASTRTRLLNDIYGYKDDMSRGYVTNSINCYKKQYGVTEEETFRKLHEMVTNIDKVLNEEYLKPINVPRQVLKGAIDCVRLCNVTYSVDDEFTRPGGKFKNLITSIYVDL